MPIRLASLDMAGTTIDEGGTVYAVLRDTVQDATGAAISDSLLSSWSGTSKYEAIVGLLTALKQDASRADAIFATFSESLAAAYEADPPRLIPGVSGALATLRESGVRVALQTGYTRDVADGLLQAVGWSADDDFDALITADDVAASRPAPYLVFRTMEATDVRDVREVLVAGDTAKDLQAGVAAGARYVVGVLTGAHTAAELGAVRHTHVLPSVAGLPGLLRRADELPTASR